MRVLLILLIMVLGSFYSKSQSIAELKGDTIFLGEEKCAIITRNGSGWNVNGIEGKWFVQIKEGEFIFSNGKVAYPEVTTFSKEKAVKTLSENYIFKKGGGLDFASVDRMVKWNPVRKSVLPSLRTNPNCNLEE